MGLLCDCTTSKFAKVRFQLYLSVAAGQSIISSFTSDNHKLPLLQFENDWVDLKSEE